MNVGTLSKLNPNIRAARKRRKQAAREMERFANMYSRGNFRVESLADALHQVSKDPRFSSAEKDAKFVSLLNRQQNNGFRGS